MSLRSHIPPARRRGPVLRRRLPPWTRSPRVAAGLLPVLMGWAGSLTHRGGATRYDLLRADVPGLESHRPPLELPAVPGGPARGTSVATMRLWLDTTGGTFAIETVQLRHGWPVPTPRLTGVARRRTVSELDAETRALVAAETRQTFWSRLSGRGPTAAWVLIPLADSVGRATGRLSLAMPGDATVQVKSAQGKFWYAARVPSVASSVLVLGRAVQAAAQWVSE